MEKETFEVVSLCTGKKVCMSLFRSNFYMNNNFNPLLFSHHGLFTLCCGHDDDISIMYMRENCGIFTNFVWLSEHIKMNCF